MVRTLDPEVDAAIAAADLSVLVERGFTRLSMDEVARVAGVGKPAIYRRFSDKTALVAHVIATQLPELDVSDRGDTCAEFRHAVEHGLPVDGSGYVRLIGGLIAEHDRHPELIEAFRHHVLLPRRAVVQAWIYRVLSPSTC
ncbi:MAG: helix-turn-helix domain-containing protein [Solirubrobacteraceae bacterium]